MHDYGWQDCGGTYSVRIPLHLLAPASETSTFGLLPVGSFESIVGMQVHMGCIYVDHFGRLYPSPERFPSTAVNSTYGSWKPFVDRVHAKGIAFGIHLMHGVPKIAAAERRPIMGSEYTAADIVANFSGSTCATFIPDSYVHSFS